MCHSLSRDDEITFTLYFLYIIFCSVWRIFSLSHVSHLTKRQVCTEHVNVGTDSESWAQARSHTLISPSLSPPLPQTELHHPHLHLHLHEQQVSDLRSLQFFHYITSPINWPPICKFWWKNLELQFSNFISSLKILLIKASTSGLAQPDADDGGLQQHPRHGRHHDLPQLQATVQLVLLRGALGPPQQLVLTLLLVVLRPCTRQEQEHRQAPEASGIFWLFTLIFSSVNYIHETFSTVAKMQIEFPPCQCWNIFYYTQFYFSAALHFRFKCDQKKCTFWNVLVELLQ